jgi:hypothetical protein
MPDQNTTKPNMPLGGTPQDTTPPTNAGSPQGPSANANQNSTRPVGTENIETPPPPIVTSGKGSEDQEKSKTNVNLPPVVNKTTSGGGSGKKKKIVAAILGLLLLVGGVGAGVYLVQQQQDIREKAAGGCGTEPDYNFNRPPSTIGPFTQSGKVTIYYRGMEAGVRKINLRYKGQDYTITTTSDKIQNLSTPIQVSSGDTIELINIESPEEEIPSCAPDKSTPQYAWGWIDVNADLTCGSGLPGPPTSGTTIPFDKISVANDINGYTNPVVSRQCWSDWREWPGDYDFNDFFLMFATENPLACGSLTASKSTISSNESVTLTAKTSGGDATSFIFAAYNRDNEYSPGNSKPVCVTSGGDITTETKDCPAGSHHLIFKYSNTTPRTTGTKTLAYNQLFVADTNNGGALVKKASINAFFGDDKGNATHSDPKCVTYVNASSEGTPPPTPTATPTNPPGVSGQCIEILAYSAEFDQSGSSKWTKLSAEDLKSLSAGDTVYFTVRGSVSSGTIDKARFSVSSTPTSSPTWRTAVTTKIPQSEEFYDAYTIPEGQTSFYVNAQVHHLENNRWF